MLRKLSLVLISSITLLGCAPNQGPNETAGGMIGALSGALIGSQFGSGEGKVFGVAIGAYLGSYVGSSYGKKLDARDKKMAEVAIRDSLENQPDKKPVTWENPNTKHSGTVKVVKTEDDRKDNLVCRDFVHTVLIDGEVEKVHGRACRDVRDVKAQWRMIK